MRQIRKHDKAMNLTSVHTITLIKSKGPTSSDYVVSPTDTTVGKNEASNDASTNYIDIILSHTKEEVNVPLYGVVTSIIAYGELPSDVTVNVRCPNCVYTLNASNTSIEGIRVDTRLYTSSIQCIAVPEDSTEESRDINLSIRFAYTAQ